MNLDQLVKSPQKRDYSIGYFTLRKLIGWLGISLPFLLLFFQPLAHKMHRGIEISEAHPVKYHYLDKQVEWYGGTACHESPTQVCEEKSIPDFLGTISNYHQFYMRDIFVGILFILAAFLITYQGEGLLDNILSSLAGLCAVIVAIAPCYVDTFYKYHYIAAVGLFFIFMLFCFLIFMRQTPLSMNDPHFYLIRAQRRTYRVCGFIILICLLGCGYLKMTHHSGNLIFWLESVMLWSFGTSWLASGRFQMARIRLFYSEKNKQRWQNRHVENH